MTYQQPLLVVRDMERSLAFYQEVLGLEKILDFGANVTLTGGIALQTLDSWRAFLGTEEIRFGGKDAELYFVEEDLEGFLARLEGKQVEYAHPLLEHRWGQRVVRLLDPDGHVLEIAEPLSAVCRRFLDQGMTIEEVAARMDVSAEYARDLAGI